MTYQLIHANANNLPLQDESVDLIITSPPYFALRSYRDGRCSDCNGEGTVPHTGYEYRICTQCGQPDKRFNCNECQAPTKPVPQPECTTCDGTGGGEHYDGQLGSEATPAEFLDALIACTAEMKRVLKPTGSIFVNLGDKYAGSGGHNNTNLSAKSRASSTLAGKQYSHIAGEQQTSPATRRNAPDRYNQHADGIRAKSLMGLPWRYAIKCIDQLNLILRSEIIWHKPNGLHESVTDRTRRFRCGG